MMIIKKTARVTKNDCLEMADEIRILYTIIRKRQAPFLGHIMRKGALVNIAQFRKRRLGW